jgi:2-keto-4-pentenoate hydratase
MMTFSLDALAQQLRDAERTGQAIAPLKTVGMFPLRPVAAVAVNMQLRAGDPGEQAQPGGQEPRSQPEAVP